MKINYEWSWVCLSLFRRFKDDNGNGGSSRVFTLKPAWLWQYWQNEFMIAIGAWPPDPFYICERWLKRNNLWHREGESFLAAITMYGNSCEPGTLVKLNQRLLR